MPFEQPWRPSINWKTPAGRLIDRLIAALPAERQWQIIVFGSSPLQLGIDPTFLSGDVVIISSDDVEGYGQEIIAPALAQRRRNYGQDGHYLRDALRSLG